MNVGEYLRPIIACHLSTNHPITPLLIYVRYLDEYFMLHARILDEYFLLLARILDEYFMLHARIICIYFKLLFAF